MGKLNHVQRVAVIPIVVVGLIILALWAIFHPKLRPERKIPDLEIMYPSGYSTLHFINSDGTVHEERKVNRSLVYVRWGLDGQSIVARRATTKFSMEGYPVLITLDGRFKSCRRYEGGGELWGIGGSHVAIGDTEAGEIYVVDMNTCKKLRTLYSNPAASWNFSISPDGWLAFSEEKRLYILDANGQEVFRSEDRMAPGPWSPDGEWLAHVKEGAIYVMRKDGSESRLLAESGSLTSWSPDGQWIVYVNQLPPGHPTVNKVNVSTGEIIELAQDPYNWVSWRSID